jgi:hypothetical protein
MSITDKPKKKWYGKEWKYIAEHLTQTKGGEVDRWLDEFAKDGTEFCDNFLTRLGFRLETTYNYTAPDDARMYQVLKYRHSHVKEAKEFLVRREGATGNQWVFGAGRVRVVYRWRGLAERPDADVYVCEGEKDADRLTLLVATCVASQKWTETCAEALRGRNVFILEDNDKAGRKNSAACAEALKHLAKSIRVVKLPGLQHKGDVSDWLEAGHVKEELIDIAAGTPLWGVHIPFINVWDLDDVDVPDQLWAVPDRFPIGHTALFSGEGGAGKSTIELQKAIAHVLEVPWLGIPVASGKALFIDAEDDAATVQRRVKANLRYLGRKSIELKDKLYTSSWVGDFDPVLAAEVGRSGKIEMTDTFTLLTEMIGDIRPITCSIASSANVFAGKEIDRSQVQQFVTQLSKLARLGCSSITLISHPSLTGINTGTGLSGSTQWHNAVRARCVLNGLKEEEGEPQGTKRVIVFRKSNFGPISSEIILEYRADLGLYVTVEGTTVDAETRKQKAEEVYLEVAQLLISQHQELSAATSRSGAALLISRHPRSTSFTATELEQAQQRLLDAGKIHIKAVGSASKAKKIIALGPDPNPGGDPL